MSKNNVAVQPLEVTIYEFVPTRNFKNNGSEYIKDMSYNVRENNHKLHDLVQEWDDRGLVNIKEVK